MDYAVTILADSVGPHGVRLTTFALRYPRAAVHEDFLTHRDFSRNASSSRAMPVRRMLERATWCPEVFGKNGPGMGAENVLENQQPAREAWSRASVQARYYAQELMNLGVAKEDANLLLRPFEWIDVVVSATRWENFVVQRADQTTGLVRRQVKRVADGMRDLLRSESPAFLSPGQWHLPYVMTDALLGLTDDAARLDAAYASAMRCARVSYARHDGTHSTIEEDKAACLAKLREPRHWSPMEHPSMCVALDEEFWSPSNFGNFDPGWLQLRKLHADEYVRAAR